MTRRRAASRVLSFVKALAIVLVLTACSRATPKVEYQYLRVTINGYQTLGISPKEGMIRGVVVYFHDAGVDEFSLTAVGPQQGITGSLVQSGFAVISAGIGKDGFGDPALVDAYLKLGAVASEHYRSDRLYLLSSGIGAIPAVGALAELANLQRIRGLVAINPVLDLETAPPQYETAISRQVPLSDPRVNPMRLPVDALAGRRVSIFVDSANDVSKSQADKFAARFESRAEVKVTECDVSASAEKCYPGDEVVTLFSQFERAKT